MILDRFKTLRKLQTLIQREGQARSPTKSERDSAVLEGLGRGEGGGVLLRGLWEWRGAVWRSLSLATDKVERILKMLESQSKTIYDKK